MPILLHRVSDITLSEITAGSSVLDGAEALSRVYDFGKHPYFSWMRAPTTRLEEFRRSQAPYLHFVEHFSRALTAVLARVPAMERRLATVYENVVEEHGHGSLEGTHRDTFAGYLRAIGLDVAEAARECPIRVAVAYQSLLDFCLVNPAEMGAAATGIVEYTHIKISTMLAQTIHERFWGDLDAQRHYRLHAEIDAEHAVSLFALCEEGWKHPASARRIAYAMAYGVHVWWSLFDAMCPAEILTPSATDGIRPLIDGAFAREPVAPLHAGRRHCDLPVRMRHEGGAWQAGRATSLGPFGLVLAGVRPPPLDATIEVSIDGLFNAVLPIPGRVRSPAGEHGGFCVEFVLDNEAQRAEVRNAVRARLVAERTVTHGSGADALHVV
ncbi:iron-containing redox enzyme family protein [Polyangium jinanense]|uniref:Iron-containing redox enzyme family protein n=1 Tax=Polyangium jinanense TaxID=2829994 RepID=A0A9X3XCQ6_9BACT|nr:iron-containing redox enzyme family protein [Polyangium jinanense]MDC3959847.1 iron-containing redox enzyme family protein [Polyangium jinanense]MDC3986298.1 iron-containing redox enzyme family protein [Polyangium jinanense]